MRTSISGLSLSCYIIICEEEKDAISWVVQNDGEMDELPEGKTKNSFV